MMLTLYGLPGNFHYKDVKALIRTQCEIADFILDNLSVENGYKKIRVGLATESEGSQLMKCLDGFQIQGCLIKVMPIVKNNAPEPAPMDYQRDMVQPNYDAVRPSPWVQEPQWSESQTHGTYQQYPQNQPYVEPQQQQSIPIVNRQRNAGSRFQTQQNYDKPVTIMKENFQGPQYDQQTQPPPFQSQQTWTPQMQQPQSYQAPNKVQYNRQLCEVQPDTQFGPSHRPSQMTGRGIEDREMSRGDHRRVSPGRNPPIVSPSTGMGHPRNVSPHDRRQLGHNRRMSPTGHHSERPALSNQYDSPTGIPSGQSPVGHHMTQGGRHQSPPGHQSGRHVSPPGRQKQQTGRYDSPPRRQMPQGGRHISPPGRQKPQDGRHISPPGRQMPQGGRHISPPGRQMPHGGRHISPPGRQMLQGGRHTSPPSRQMPQSDRHISPHGRHMPQGGRHISPPGRQMPQSGRFTSPSGRQMPQSGRFTSPSGRQMPQGSRRISPPGRQMPQGSRHISPPGRQMPQGGRHISPPGRQMPQGGRQISPERQMPQGGRHISPPGRQMPQCGRHISPERQMPQGGRHISPERQMSQGGRRVSPPGRQIHVSPPGRQMPQGGRLAPPSGRQILLSAPPGRKLLPGRLGSPPGRIQISRQASPPGQKSPGRQGRQMSPGRRISPTWRRISPSGRHVLIPARNISPSGRFSPPGRTVLINERRAPKDRPGRQISPRLLPDRRASPNRTGPSGRIVSPTRRVSPSGRHVSLTRRRDSPERRISPPGLRVAPPGRHISPPGRRISPPRRRISPPGRCISPSGRRVSPSGRRISPSGRPLHDSRRASPMRQESRQHVRYSPPHRGPTKTYDQEDPRASFKQAIQLYDKASDQGMYSGFRPNAREDKYPRNSPPRDSRWQEREPRNPDKVSGSRFPDHRGKEGNKSRSLTRESIRDRSPIRGPKRNSPSPRSPRRSWALEKRHSPDIKDAPPPPAWPGQKPAPHYPDRRKEWHKPERSHPTFDEKDCISNWKSHPSDRFAEGHKKFDDAYEKSGNFQNRDDRKSFGDKHYYKEEPRYGVPGKESQKEYQGKEIKQDYTEERNRAPQTLNYKNASQISQLKNANQMKKIKYDQQRFEKSKKKRTKAALEIASNIMKMCGAHLVGKKRELIHKEVLADVYRLMYQMFLDVDVPFLDIITKFGGKHSKHYETIFSWSVKRLSEKLKKVQKAGSSDERKKVMKKNRLMPSEKRLVVDLAKRIQDENQQKDKASTEPSQPKQLQQPKQPVKTQPAKPTPKPAQKPIPTKKVEPDSSAVKEGPKNLPEKETKVEASADAPKEQKRQSGDIKVLSVAQINEQTDKNRDTQKDMHIESKPEDKATETKKPEETVESNHYELNELMSNVLKKELRGVMDKVWSCLLVQPDTPEETIALDLIRTQAVDPLRDAIGLNVAKRLLNVFNPLFVKIHFSCRPENGCLTGFLSQHNIKSFKRIPSAQNTFAAQLQSIADFDKLCYTEGIKCGSADLKITPCYKFTQCPPNLKLNLDDDDYYMYPSDDDYDDEEIDAQMFDEFDKESTEKDEADSDKVIESTQDSQNKTNDKTAQGKSAGDMEPKKTVNKEVTESKNVEAGKTEKGKVSESTKPTAINKQGTENASDKLNNAKSDAKTKEIPSKDFGEKKAQAKHNEKINQKPKAETAKATPKKDTNKTNDVTKEKSNSKIKNTTKPVQAKNVSQALKRKQSVGNNDVRKKIAKTKPRVNKRSFEVIDEVHDGDDDDEMADKDILALLSGGVVLDECGSDD